MPFGNSFVSLEELKGDREELKGDREELKGDRS